MLVDWFTVIAQILNFLILVALLKRFLFDRIIRAMDKREEGIRAKLEEADSKRKEAEGEAESYRRQNEDLKQKRDRMLGEAKKEADRKLKELTREARQEVERARSRWHESLDKEKGVFLQDLKVLAAQEVYALSRRALKDLADAQLEEHLVDVFVSKLKELEKEDKDVLAEAIGEEQNRGAVRSGFDLSPESRRKITTAVRGEIAQGAEIDYETDPRVIMGIELRARGEKAVWSVRDYLAELEERAKTAIEEEILKGDGDKGGAQEAEEQNETRQKEESEEDEESEAVEITGEEEQVKGVEDARENGEKGPGEAEEGPENQGETDRKEKDAKQEEAGNKGQSGNRKKHKKRRRR